MSEELLVQCCAPTLAGIKTGSMFSIECETKERMMQELRELNRILHQSGLCIHRLGRRFYERDGGYYRYRAV